MTLRIKMSSLIIIGLCTITLLLSLSLCCVQLFSKPEARITTKEIIKREAFVYKPHTVLLSDNRFPKNIIDTVEIGIIFQVLNDSLTFISVDIPINDKTYSIWNNGLIEPKKTRTK